VITHVVISDVHGNYRALERLLHKTGTLTSRGKHPDHRVVFVGDVVNLAPLQPGFDDLEALKMAVTVADLILLGNHELPYLAPGRPGSYFVGYQPPVGDLAHEINVAQRDGHFIAAAVIHGWLITHAGLHPYWQERYGWSAGTPARMVGEWLNDHFYDWLTHSTGEGAVFDSVSALRGGRDPVGGIFWADMKEHKEARNRNRIPQIFGHTALSTNPVLFPQQEGAPFWCIDSGFPTVTALVKRGSGNWQPYTASVGDEEDAG
jgi:hypothetical protein